MYCFEYTIETYKIKTTAKKEINLVAQLDNFCIFATWKRLKKYGQLSFIKIILLIFLRNKDKK